MNRKMRIVLGIAALAIGGVFTYPAFTQVPDGGDSPFPEGFGMRRIDPRIQEFQNISKASKTYDGLFKLYHKGEHLYAELQPRHMDKPLLCPIAVAKGAGMGGMTLNSDEQWVLLFKRAGDKVHLVRRNVHNKAKGGSPTQRAMDITYSDSVLMSLRIAAINQMNQGVLIDLNDIFMTDFAQLGLGHFDANRSVWHKVKAFPKNIELQVQATYGGRFGGWGLEDDDNIDARGKTVVIHYGLAELPEGGYTPRVADDRVGYFVTALKDFSSGSKDTSFVRYVNRWRLEPAESVAPGKLSVPKRSIKFYIEKTVPHEYRAAVQEGILEWNKAFEKIGFRNAIEVVQQRDDEDFDPEDMNYNTFRWITSDVPFAIGPSRANPLTGEILDADILFDASLIRFWKRERQLQRSDGLEYQPVSPIQAMDQGWGLDHGVLSRRAASAGWDDRPGRMTPEQARLAALRQGVCQCPGHMRMQLSLGALALGDAFAAGPPKGKDQKDKQFDELLQQAVKHVVMHEVGHTLGLRHNFKASTMLPNDQLHDTKVTREKGLVGSVMDYSPVNLARKGAKQGDYFSVTLGPYDYWAIEYAYKPISGDEAAELKKIAAKGASTPGLDYGTDEDTFLTSDPHINRDDLGQDVMAYAQDRMLAAEELLKSLATTVVEEGEGYQRARVAFNLLLGQYGDGAYLVSKYVGGEHAHRDHRGDAKARDPLVPVTAAKQRDALKFLREHLFTDKAFQFPPELLRKLAAERWMHWGADVDSTDFPLYDRVLGIQRLAMNQLLDPSVLRRVQANALKSDKEAKPVTVAEVFRTVTDGVWSDLPNGDAKKDIKSSIIRRNLQREHVRKLTTLVLGERPTRSPAGFRGYMTVVESSSRTVPPDARSLARYHLREIAKRIDIGLIAKANDTDETTVAHLEECKEKIGKVLSASMQAND
ncbi:MAG: zinc-dependent metalloprotease [Gemmataceae bacterium]